MQVSKTPIAQIDESFLFRLYSTTREEEMSFVDWSDDQKTAFLKSQFSAQNNHYFTKYPQAAFQIINLNEEKIGRLYLAELDNEIRIIDLTIVPEKRNWGIGTTLINEIIRDAENKKKPVQIYLELNNRSGNLFSRLGFEVSSTDGVFQLWRREFKAGSFKIESIEKAFDQASA